MRPDILYKGVDEALPASSCTDKYPVTG
jgi:hypothetical protein